MEVIAHNPEDLLQYFVQIKGGKNSLAGVVK